MALTDGLVAVYRLNEASGDAVDALGNYPCTATGAPDSVGGQLGAARQFSAAKYFKRPADEAAFDMLLSDWAVSAWVYLTSDVLGTVVCKGATNSTDPGWWVLHLNGAGLYAQFGNGSTRVALNRTPITLNAWHHLVVNWDRDGSLAIYIDGSVAANQSASIAASSAISVNNANAFGLGVVANTSGSPWVGRLDEVMIYSRILDATERAALWNGGAGLAYPFTSAGGAPISHPLSPAFRGPFG